MLVNDSPNILDYMKTNIKYLIQNKKTKPMFGTIHKVCMLRWGEGGGGGGVKVKVYTYCLNRYFLLFKSVHGGGQKWVVRKVLHLSVHTLWMMPYMSMKVEESIDTFFC